MKKNEKKVVVIVLNYNDSDNTIGFIESIKHFETINQIVIVDNCSNDNSYERLLSYKNTNIDVIKTENNKGYAYGNNYGVKYAIEHYSVKYIVISNPDVNFEEIVICKMIDKLQNNKKIGQIAPVMKSPKGRKENIAWKLPTYYDNLLQLFILMKSKKYLKLNAIDNSDTMKVDVLPGSFFMISKNVFEDVGFFDESTFLYGEENILAFKLMNKGYQNILLIDETFIHQHGASINKSITSQEAKFKYLYDAVIIYNKKYLKTGIVKNLISYVVWQISKLERKFVCMIKCIKSKRIKYVKK